MNKFIYIFCFLFCISNISASSQGAAKAQTVNLGKNYIIFKGQKVEHRNDSLILHFQTEYAGRFIGANEMMEIIPYFKSGSTIIQLPKIILIGNKRAPYFKREQSLISHEQFVKNIPYATNILNKPGSNTHLQYRSGIVLPATLKGGEFFIRKVVYNCCNATLSQGERLIAYEVPKPAPAPIMPTNKPIKPLAKADENGLTYIAPEKEAVKLRSQSATSYISFVVNKWDIKPEYMRNSIELFKIDTILKPITSNPKFYKVNLLEVKGYASPEGKVEKNEMLAANRANSFMNYLADKYNVLSMGGQKKVLPGGEDWEGLQKLVEESNMPNKEKVLSIIQTEPDPETRELKLKGIAKGATYRYLLTNFYPKLRRIDFKTDYQVQDFEDGDASEMIKKRPQDLSLYEMYRVAMAAKIGSVEYYEALRIAAQYYPNDVAANINAASGELLRGNLAKAETYLLKADDRGDNNRGVLLMMKGKFKEAEAMLNKALATDPDKAAYNLEVLRKQLAQ